MCACLIKFISHKEQNLGFLIFPILCIIFAEVLETLIHLYIYLSLQFISSESNYEFFVLFQREVPSHFQIKYTSKLSSSMEYRSNCTGNFL